MHNLPVFPCIKTAGENSLIVYLAATMSHDCAAKIAHLTQLVEQQLGDDLIDLIPSFTSLLVLFNPVTVNHDDCTIKLQTILQQLPLTLPSTSNASCIELPVYYDGDDLAAVANLIGLSIAEVIELHSTTTYRCYAVGFAPGFAYLGEVHPTLQLPRRSTPRLKVPAGAVAIAGKQTAVYPTESPGGWHILGRSPARLFAPKRQPACLVQVGDQVQFAPITANQFASLTA